MAELIALEVITPQRVLFKEQVEALVIPGVEGRLGILPRHAPMVALLRPGVLTYRQGGQLHKVAVSGGFCEVSDDRAVILADAAERAADIDVLRARRAKERALRRLRSRDRRIDHARARAALERALARLKAAGVED